MRRTALPIQILFAVISGQQRQLDQQVGGLPSVDSARRLSGRFCSRIVKQTATGAAAYLSI